MAGRTRWEQHAVACESRSASDTGHRARDVFLTPNGDCKGLYVTARSAASFEVHELSGGTSNVEFDYRIVARRSGYENIRLADYTDSYNGAEAQRVRMRQSAGQYRSHFPAVPPASARDIQPRK